MSDQQNIDAPLFAPNDLQPELTDDQAGLVIANVIHQEMLDETSRLGSLRLDAKVLGHEILDHEHKLKALGATAVTLSTQTADRFRLLIPIVVTAARSTYEHSSSFMPAGTASILAGGVGGAAFWLWAQGVGEPLNRSIRMLPKTVDNVSRTFPSLVEIAEDALPGMKEDEIHPKTAETNSSPLIDRIKNTYNAVGRFAGKGLVAITMGTTAYTLTSIARGDTQQETTKINRKVANVGAVVLGSLATTLIGTAEGLARNGQEGAARWIDDWIINNNYLWYGLAFGIMGVSVVASRLKKQGKEPLFYQVEDPYLTSVTPIPETPAPTIRRKIMDRSRSAIHKLKDIIPHKQESL